MRTSTPTLPKLAAEATAAEKKWLDAQAGSVRVHGEEVIARLTLVRQLQKHEGALIAVFPGHQAGVRSFFRPSRWKKSGAGQTPRAGAGMTYHLDR